MQFYLVFGNSEHTFGRHSSTSTLDRNLLIPLGFLLDKP